LINAHGYICGLGKNNRSNAGLSKLGLLGCVWAGILVLSAEFICIKELKTWQTAAKDYRK
jgi:hypothetical protein